MTDNTAARTFSGKPGLYEKLFYALVFGAFLFMLSYRLVQAFYPMPNTGGAENNIIYFVQRILAGKDLYADPSNPPYAIAQYTPLYYYLVAALAKLCSIDHSQVLELFIVNRLTSFFVYLTLSFLVAVVLKTSTRLSTNASLITGLLVFVFIQPLSRPDSLELLLWVCSFWLFLQSLKEEEKGPLRKYYWLSAIAGMLAVLAKQNAFTILLMIPAWLFVKRRFRDAIRYTLIVTALGFLTLVFVSLVYDADLVFKNVVLGINNGTSYSNFTQVILNFYKLNILLLVAMLAACFLLWERKDPTSRFFAWAMIGQFIFSNLFALKAGSGINYLMEWLVLVIVGTALCAERLQQIFDAVKPRFGLFVVALAIIFHIVPSVNSLYWYSRKTNFQFSKNGFLEEKAVADFINARTTGEGNYILTDISTPGSFLSNLCEDRLLLPQSDIINNVYGKNIYDHSQLKRQVDHGEIRFIISRHAFDTLSFLDFRFTGYKLDTTVGPYFVYGK